MKNSRSLKTNPEELPAGLARALHQGASLTPAQQPFPELCGVPGAYALIIRLESAFRLEIPALGATQLNPGWYVYAGNAYGPGGLAARLKRHCKAGKAVHWHVDRLTAAASVRALRIRPDGDECPIIAQLCASGAFAHPVRGFGASDCRVCQSHLLVWTGASGTGNAAA